jgi:hypothetical protein
MNERRCNRSTDPIAAAHCLLASAAHTSGHIVLALVDQDGLLIADSGSDIDIEAVAAIAPLAAHGSLQPQDFLALVTRGATLRVWDFQMQGHTYFLVGLGGGAACPSGVTPALLRILAPPSIIIDIAA